MTYIYLYRALYSLQVAPLIELGFVFELCMLVPYIAQKFILSKDSLPFSIKRIELNIQCFPLKAELT